MHDEFDGFSIYIFYDQDDNDYVAHFVELPKVSAFGKTREDAIEELKVAWKGVKQSYLNKGEEVPIPPQKKYYNGQVSLRIDKRLHRALAIEASKANVSLNALLAQKLSKEIFPELNLGC